MNSGLKSRSWFQWFSDSKPPMTATTATAIQMRCAQVSFFQSWVSWFILTAGRLSNLHLHHWW